MSVGRLLCNVMRCNYRLVWCMIGLVCRFVRFWLLCRLLIGVLLLSGKVMLMLVRFFCWRFIIVNLDVVWVRLICCLLIIVLLVLVC